MNAAEAATYVVEALSGGEPVAEVVVVASESADAPLGARVVVCEDRMEGSLGAAAIDAAAAEAGRESLRSRKSVTRRVEGKRGEVELFVEPHHPPDELLIVGAGHIARPLAHIGAMLGFRVIVLDDRPGFATRDRFPDAARLVNADFSDPFRDVPLGRGTHLVLVTRGHKYDYEALRDVLLRGLELGYIGMVGSQRRVRAALEQLVREGIPRERLERVYAPIGLDIGAETPEEIAISIIGEIIRLRRGGTGESLRDRARVLERWIKE
ncbi:MAG TPA: XdhC family protein [Longimicrobiaceae bacterium]|nr:XdhC family protein [Longimicrobiaceae bacterium]